MPACCLHVALKSPSCSVVQPIGPVGEIMVFQQRNPTAAMKYQALCKEAINLHPDVLGDLRTNTDNN